MLTESENVFAVLAIFFAVASLGVYVESRRWGKRLSAVVVIIGLSILFANVGILPDASPVYEVIWYFFVPLAIALFLIKADLVSIFSQGGRVLIAFALGAIGVVIGTVLGLLAFDLGANETKYAAVFAATYIGGSLNFVSVAQAIAFDDRTSLAAAISIDNVLGISFIITATFAPALLMFRRAFAWRVASLTDPRPPTREGEAVPSRLLSYLLALAIGSAACAAGIALGNAAGAPSYSILAITIIMLSIATIGRTKLSALDGGDTLAIIFMYLFFAYLGTGADIQAMVGAAPVLFLLVLVILVSHLICILLGSYLSRINYAEIVVASLACIGGPPVATAVAILFGWDRLVVPGIVTGVFGYAIGTFLGVGIFHLAEMMS